jgi:hypothetical protein
MILNPHADGLVAVLQSAHAFAAFQIADHWGNRLTPRPSPRTEVLAAVLLHDAGWDGHETPQLDAHGRPVAFDTLTEPEHERIWVSSVERAAVIGRYAEYLVSHHVSSLAAMAADDRHSGFLAKQEARRAQLRSELSRDPRYRSALAAEADQVNRAVMRIADALAVHLVRGGEDLLIPNLPRRGGSAPLSVRRVAERTYRLRPWPLVGRRLDISTEGRLLAAQEFSDLPTLRSAWADARTVRLTWTLCSPAEVGR